MGNSYTMTKLEMINQIKEYVTTNFKDSFMRFLDGKISSSYFEGWYNISKAIEIKYPDNAVLSQLMDYWADKISESWLESHPDVDDVLLLVNDDDENCIIKSWMASK